MKREYKLFIQDIKECIAQIDEFVGDMTLEEFKADEKTSSAVVRKIESIGEATKNVPKEIRQKYKELPWSDMAKMRDKMSTDDGKKIYGLRKITVEPVYGNIKENFGFRGFRSEERRVGKECRSRW